ncbi:MAG: polyphosphate polymerase domain-containing protein [Paracoccaceae bacterium]
MNMHDPRPELGWLLDSFASVSLDELNAHSDMMSRIDNKYVVRRAALAQIVPDLVEQFDILDIEGRRAFTYDTRYFDDAERSAYYEHHQGLRKGFKVRVRSYADAGPCFLEVKVKGKRGMTVKHRIPHDPSASGHLSAAATEFVHSTYGGHYGKPFRYDLRWVMDIRYKRITLVAKQGGERMTIDTDLQFWSRDKHHCVGSNAFIVETKSALGRGFADRCLRDIHERPTKKCSKYCIGMATLGEVSRFNLFLPTMRKLDLVGAVPHPAEALQRAAA